jgi:quercetin dioxygenase-like cupin family protein
MKLEKIADKMVYSDQSITKRVIFKENRILNFMLNLSPGQTVPPHNHENSDLLVHVLTGEAEMTVDDKTCTIVAGDIIHCDGKEMFSLKNNGKDNLSCFVILTPNPSAMYSKEF